jgi:hypothetical protein
MQLAATQEQVPELSVGRCSGPITIDGRLDEADWRTAKVGDAFHTTEPIEGGTPNGRTEIRVLADGQALYFGIRCFDPQPDGIVAHAVARDADLTGEDHVKIVLGTFADGRTGYVFAVNPRGARYDALIASRGQDEDRSWDGPWEARTTVDAEGWTAEIRLPAIMLAYAEGAVWHCNVERRVQRLLERSRWSNPLRDQPVTNMARAGHLVGIPVFDLGLGLAVRPALVGDVTKAPGAGDATTHLEPSLDVTWRTTPQFTTVLSVNTDFAETEVDERRSNLTRFPLLFPEKRTFFLEGADAFDFGLGLEETLLPFYSRRIGLVDGVEVPILVAGKGVGRIGGTSVGALVAHTDSKSGVAPETTMGVVRIRQDVLAQSSVGMIATTGDPKGRSDNAMLGVDATYQTSELFGGRNLLVGAWALTLDRGPNASNAGAWGTKIDYPNDDWNINASWQHIDTDFEPPIGFVERTGVDRYHFGADRSIRPENDWLRKQTFESGSDLVLDLDGRWTTWRVFTSPVNAVFESGDGVEFNVIGEGQRFQTPFEIADGVVIPGGRYEWLRYRAVATAAEKRPLAGEVSWGFGDFYDGQLDEWQAELRLVASSLLTLRATADVIRGRLPQGHFAEDFYGFKVSFTFSPDLTLDSFVQYDTESRNLGTNTRLRWDVTPQSQVFVVLNMNFLDQSGAFESDGYQTIVKIQHEMRF